ncbi:alpha/beta fold hydrolase [Nocardioides sp. MAHUQ-72]|uniref:alpha/beta fold hydrolase n=1 Tax=unclassified Nocardioides TaxID=2615069 RepID=UPI00361C4CFF
MTAGWGRVERPDAEIWYYDTAEDKPIVVLLHGLAGYALEWGATIEALRQDWCVVAVEQRGHGSSTRRPDDVSRQAYVDDVLAVLDDLGVDQVPVVGQSMGANTAMLLAARAPERVDRLVLVEGGLGGDSTAATDGIGEWLASWPVPFEDREEFLDFFRSSRMVAETWADGLEQRPDGLWPQWDAEVLTRAVAHLHEREHLEEWSQVHAPTLLVRGEHGSLPDRQVESMCALRPDTEVITVAGAGHDVHLEAPEAWLRALTRFLTHAR